MAALVALFEATAQLFGNLSINARLTLIRLNKLFAQ